MRAAPKIPRPTERFVRSEQWCPGPELNRYVLLGTRDFKSRASASFATRAFAGN